MVRSTELRLQCRVFSVYSGLLPLLRHRTRRRFGDPRENASPPAGIERCRVVRPRVDVSTSAEGRKSPDAIFDLCFDLKLVNKGLSVDNYLILLASPRGSVTIPTIVARTLSKVA